MALRLGTLGLILPLASLIAAAGCADPCEQKLQALRDEAIEAEDRIEKLQEENRQLADSLQSQEELIQRLRGLSQKRMAHLFTVQNIELGDYTTGVNLDDEPGDDGVRVRMVPIDAAGSALKAAGSVSVQLYDLAQEDDPLVGKCDFGVEGIGDYWSGHFGTYHYRFECKFSRVPAHEDITVRVEFTDHLTGKVVRAQKVITVDLPAKRSEPPTDED
jgi:hypothetical protein